MPPAAYGHTGPGRPSPATAGGDHPGTTAGEWRGRTVLRPGWLAYTGMAGTTAPHAHATVQVMIVTAGVVELSDPRRGHGPVRAAVIPARVRHAVHAGPGARATMIYLDPAGGAGRRLTAGLRGPGHDRLDRWAEAARALLPPADPGVAPDPAALVRGWSAPAGVRHPALRRALRVLPELLHGPVRLTDLAAAAGISASRLGHLFSAELGLPFSPYLRWARLRRAVELAAGGASLTQAAHGAGFADSSHLTRVTREMFGLAPSRLLAALSPPAP
nr:AraC family transcriptional regulator [Microbispora rosea]